MNDLLFLHFNSIPMEHKNKFFIAKNTPLRLTPDEIGQPMEVIIPFFNALCLDEAREILWEVFSRAIANPEEDEPDWLSRRDLLYFHGQFEALIEASFLIYRETK